MRVERVFLEKITTVQLNLGYVGEHDHCQIVIDSTSLLMAYPNATAGMVAKSPTGVLYPVALEQDGNNVIWNVSDSDLARAGVGTFQLTFTLNGEIIKTAHGSYKVDPSLLAEGDPPDPIENWLDEANQALAEVITETGNAEAAAASANEKAGLANTAAAAANSAASLANEKANLADQKATLADQKATAANNAATAANTAATVANTAATKIDGMTASANGLNPGSSPTAVVSEVSGHKHITFGIPKGDAGKDFHIAKTFTSIAQMMAYTGTDIEAYDFAMIDTGSVQDPDTGKLYCYEPDTQDRWQYIGDLSGAQGIKGETGTGIDHITLNADYTLTIYLDDNTSYTTASIRGATGETPDISIGTVTTLNYDQQAYVTLDPSSTPEDPVFNFGIPQGEPGSAENVYGTTVPMSSTDSTKVATAINAKLDANQGSANAGKFMRVGSTGAVAYDSPTERYSSLSDFPAMGDEGKLYIAEDTGMMYVWDSEYVPVGGTSSDECEVSGDIVSFETFESKAKKLVVDIDPVQDLHGYDNPWPAGGGKNLLENNGNETFTQNGTTFTKNPDGSVKIQTSPSARANYYLQAITDQNVNQLPVGSYILSLGGIVTGTYMEMTVRDGNDQLRYISATIQSGGYTSFEISEDDVIQAVYISVFTGYSGNTVTMYPMIRLASVSDATFAPYKNICPISGWDSANVSRTGKNLLDITDVEFEGWYNADGTKELSNSYNCYLVSVKPETTYTISGNFAGIITYWDSGLNFISGANQGSGASKTFTTPSNCAHIRRSILKTNIDGTQMLELGSTVSAYEPYSGSTAEYEFPEAAGTVYGGTLTIHQDGSGELVVKPDEVDLGSLTWTYSNGIFGATIQGMKSPSTSDERKTGIISDIYPASATVFIDNRMDDKSMLRAYGNIYIRDTDYTSTTDFTSAVNGHQLVYELATPVTYQLTNQQVLSLLKGQNVVFADCGAIDLTYYRTETAYQVSLNTADIAELQQDTNGKADKVSSSTSGNFAGLDANGNLTDSGSKASDFLTSHQDISGKADKVSSATSGNFAGLDSNGNLTDSGSKASDFLTQHQDITGKADKVSSPTSGNFAALDGNGNLTDSGHKHSDYLTGKRLAAQTLSAGSTTLTFSNAAITTSSTVEAYADVYGIAPTAITVTTGQAVLTFPVQQSAVSVYIAVW